LLFVIGIVLLGPAGYKLAHNSFYFDGYLTLIKDSPTIAGSEYLENFNIFNYSRTVRLFGRIAQRFFGIFIFEELRINHYLTIFTFLLWAIVVSTLRINAAKIKTLIHQALK
jgi:hypothetical protein